MACSNPENSSNLVKLGADDNARLKGLYSNSFMKSQNIEILKDRPAKSRTIYIKTRYRCLDTSLYLDDEALIGFYASRLHRFFESVLNG